MIWEKKKGATYVTGGVDHEGAWLRDVARDRIAVGRVAYAYY